MCNSFDNQSLLISSLVQSGRLEASVLKEKVSEIRQRFGRTKETRDWLRLYRSIKNDYDFPIPSSNFDCTACGKVFSSQYNLNAHIKSSHSSSHSLFICEICDKKFKFKTSLTRHMKLHNDETDYFFCYLCSKPFSEKWRLERHERTHREVVDHSRATTYLSCRICQKKMTASNFARHKLNVHHSTPSKIYTCPHCKKNFKNERTLKAHVLLHSDIPKPYVCTQCGKKFSRFHSLNRHARRYKAEYASYRYPFPCPAPGCGEAFLYLKQLRRHQKKH